MSPTSTSQPTSAAVPTPGVDRVVHFTLQGHAFAFRRPSRADVSEAWRALTRKLALSGDPKTLDNYNGKGLLWEARLEIGLRPRWRQGAVVDLGETAPAHWLAPLLGEGNAVIDQVVDFANVDPDEFDAVAAYLEATVFAKKKPDGALPTSTGSAESPVNA